MYQRCISRSSDRLAKEIVMAWKAAGQPTVRKQRDKWVVRVDGIDTSTGKHRPETTRHVSVPTVRAGGSAHNEGRRANY